MPSRCASCSTTARSIRSTGKLLFSDAKVDAHTGQVTLRGEFRNPKRELLPGMYVRVRIDQGIDSDAIAVPQQAIQRNGGGGSEVFVVKDDNRIAVQPVRTGSVQDGIWFVTDGLKAGDKVVVEGFQKFAAGDKVEAAILVRGGRDRGQPARPEADAVTRHGRASSSTGRSSPGSSRCSSA